MARVTISQLRNEIAGLNEKIKRLETENGELSVRNHDLTEETQDAKHHAAELEAALELAMHKNRHLVGALSDISRAGALSFGHPRRARQALQELEEG